MPVYKRTSLRTGRVSWYAIFYYTDWMGGRRQKKKEGFASQRDAKDYERSFLERAAASPSMTLGSLAALYLDDYQKRFRPTSYTTRRCTIERSVLPYLREMPVGDLDAGKVRAWQNALAATGRYAASTLHFIHACLSSMLNFAMKYYGLKRNAARLAGNAWRGGGREMKFWTHEEYLRFQRAINGAEPYATAFALLFYTGMRKGELLAVTPGDIDFASGRLTVSKSYTRHRRRDLIQPPKTEKGRRVIALPVFLTERLRRVPGKSGGRMFSSVTAQGLRRNLDLYAAKAGLPRIRVHDLRHSHASLLIEQGFSPLVIKERLGHENIETTLGTYSHLYPGKQDEIAACLERLGAAKKNGGEP